MLAKVISDDGFLITLMRPCEMQKHRRGTTFELKEIKLAVDENQMFETLLTDDVIHEIVKRVKKDENVPNTKTRK
jgi:hypothetical protein